MNKECLQLEEPRGTPCFEIDVQRTVCSLDYCPAAKYLQEHIDADKWDTLHTHCVMSDTYRGDDGKGEFIATIALIASLKASKNK